MKMLLERNALADAVSWVARSLPTRPSVPILAGLLIKADADSSSVVLSTFDYETSAKIVLSGEVAESGEVLVSGRLLADICKSLPDHPIDVTADENSMELVCGPARFTLQTLPVNEYPALPEMPEEAGVVPSEDFAKAVSQVVVAAGKDELLPVFTGVRIEIEDDCLSLLATDRYRMALKEISWSPSSLNNSGAVLVPAKILNETAKSMTSGENVTMSSANSGAGEGLIGFSGSGTSGIREITTRLLDGDFPKVRHLMDINPTVTVRCNTAGLLAAVKRIALVAERNTPLSMKLGENQITLEAASGDQAQGVEAIEAVITEFYDNPLVTAGFNAHYLQDALQALDTPYVQFSFTSPGKPCLLMGLLDIDADPVPDYRHVIMLMRLPS